MWAATGQLLWHSGSFIGCISGCRSQGPATPAVWPASAPSAAAWSVCTPRMFRRRSAEWLPAHSRLHCCPRLLLQRPVNELQQLKDNVLCSWVSGSGLPLRLPGGGTLRLPAHHARRCRQPTKRLPSRFSCRLRTRICLQLSAMLLSNLLANPPRYPAGYAAAAAVRPAPAGAVCRRAGAAGRPHCGADL